MVEGDVYHGASGLAGELGHTSIDVNGLRCKCGNRGCIENYASRISLLRSIRKRVGNEGHTSLTPAANFGDVLKAHKEGDALTMSEVDRVARYLAQGITNCINFGNPDLVVIGDEYAEFGERFLRRIEGHVKERVLPRVFEGIKIELSRSSEDTVLKGAFLDVFSQTLLGPVSSTRSSQKGDTPYWRNAVWSEERRKGEWRSN